jgi:nucleotide-binding universal stress UspA family protein
LKRFKNILLVCDKQGSHDALLARASRLAKSNGARITLIDVVDSEPGALSRLFGKDSEALSLELEREVLQYHQDRLSALAAPMKSEGILTAEVVLRGIPFIEIIGKVLRDRHDLVLKGAERREAVGFASTDLHLMRKCPCPVWIMKSSRHRRYARILAAVDPDSADTRKNTLNSLIMDLATSLSRTDGSALHVVHVWRLKEENTLRQSGFAKSLKSEVDLLVERKRQQSEQALMALLDGYNDDGLPREVHLLKGSPRDRIPDLARELGVDLIVMGTVGRTGIPGLFIGNTAETTLSQAQCSVLTVKPPGFETPVRLDRDRSGAVGNLRAGV